MLTSSQKLTVNNWNIRQIAIATGQTSQEVLDKTEKGYKFCYECRYWRPKQWLLTGRTCSKCQGTTKKGARK